MANGVYKASEIVDGKVSIQEFDQQSVIVGDTGNGELLVRIINLMAGQGWVVKQCWGLDTRAFMGPSHFTLLEKPSQSDRF